MLLNEFNHHFAEITAKNKGDCLILRDHTHSDDHAFLSAIGDLEPMRLLMPESGLTALLFNMPAIANPEFSKYRWQSLLNVD